MAAVTIPTLTANFQKEAWLNAFKQDISIFSQGMKKMILNECGPGCNFTCSELFSSDNADDTYYDRLDNAFRNVFNGIKSCKDSDDDCEYNVQGLNYTFIDSRSAYGLKIWAYSSLNTKGEYMYILPNGTIFYLANRGCTQTAYPGVSKKLQTRCADIVFDVNGMKKPNVFGKDIFGIIVAEDGNIYPYGGTEFAKFLNGSSWETSKNYWKSPSANYKNNCEKGKSSQGYACSARIMESGWKMDYI